MLSLKGEGGKWSGYTPLSKNENRLMKINEPVERAAVEPSYLLFSSNTPEFQIFPHHLKSPNKKLECENLGEMAHHKAKEKIRDFSVMNINIQHSVDTIENFCKFVADEKEKEITRNYKDRLNEIQMEIERLKNREPEFDALYWNQKYRDIERNFVRMTDEANKLDAMVKESESSIKESKQELVKIRKECTALNRQLLGAKKEVHKIKNSSVSLFSSSSSGFSTQSVPHYTPYSTRSPVSVSHYSALYSKKAPHSSSSFSASSGHIQPLTLSSSLSSNQSLSAPFITTSIDVSPTASPTSFRASNSTNPFLASLFFPVTRPRPLKDRVVTRQRSQIKPVRPVIESRTIRFLAQSTDSEVVDALNHLRREHIFMEEQAAKAHVAYEVVERAKRETQRENAEARAFLQDCLDDVAKETNTIASSNISFQKQRELLNLQASRQKVLNILYDKTFPTYSKTLEKMVTITDDAGDDVYFKRQFDSERMNAEEEKEIEETGK